MDSHNAEASASGSSMSMRAPTLAALELLDSKMLAAVSAIIAAATYGTWRVLAPTRNIESCSKPVETEVVIEQNIELEREGSQTTTKRKRDKERRKRTTVAKLSKNALDNNNAGKQQAPRQSSTQKPNRQTVREASIAVSERSPYLQDGNKDDSSYRNNDLVSNNDLTARLHFDPPPQSVPSPDSSRILFQNSSIPNPQPTSRLVTTPPPPSPSPSTIASTSGIPLTPSSIESPQYLQPPDTLETYNECESKTPVVPVPFPTSQNKDRRKYQPIESQEFPSASPRGRSRRTNSPRPLSDHPAVSPHEAAFPTLNTLPPPNTPMEVQVELMKAAVEASRTREQEGHTREERLSQEVEQLRVETEQARQETSRLQWLLHDMSQREERLQSQIHSLTVQLHHARGQPPPLHMQMPLFQPQPVPFPQHPAHFFHPPTLFPTGSPMLSSNTPSTLLSPPCLPGAPLPHPHPLMAAHGPPIQRTSTAPSTPLDTFSAPSRAISQVHSPTGVGITTIDDDRDIGVSTGLVEAIMKRPEALREGSVGVASTGGQESVSAYSSTSVSGSGESKEASRSSSSVRSRRSELGDDDILGMNSFATVQITEVPGDVEEDQESTPAASEEKRNVSATIPNEPNETTLYQEQDPLLSRTLPADAVLAKGNLNEGCTAQGVSVYFSTCS